MNNKIRQTLAARK